MDEDTFPNLNVINAKKTYVKRPKKEAQPTIVLDTNNDIDNEKIEPLTTKVAVKLLLEGRLKSKVCRYCLNVTPGLSELDQIMNISGTGNMYKVTIRDIVASFHPFKVTDDPNFPNKICQKCLDRALSAYLFTQQCERAERAMLNCFDDMYEKFEKLDPIDRPKKRGRQKLNPNHNILHAEHNKVMDYAEPIINIVNSGAESFTKEPALNDLECTKCWQLLPNVESLLNHEKIHPKTMWYHCRICGKSFPKRNQLKKHNHRVHVLGKEVHSQFSKDFKCNECNNITDNYIQHLQHVEKHKFRNIMEHLIEKRTDKLCVVCFNNSTKMMELDHMVCIHGGHPDLMGDKTLYNVLASTLPEKKSYKYQELYVPSKAQIMTISKKASCDPCIKNIDPVHKGTKENFVFSYPVVFTKNRFKTDHFYFYVFCDPQILNDIGINDVVDVSGNGIEKMYLLPQFTEVVENRRTIRDGLEKPGISITNAFESDILDTEQEPSKKKAKIESNPLKQTIKTMSKHTEVVELTNSNDIKGFTVKKSIEKISKNEVKEIYSEEVARKLPTVKNIAYVYKFSDPILINNPNTDCTNITDTNKTDTIDLKTKQDGEMPKDGIHGENIFEEVKTAKVIDDKRLTKHCDVSWIFKNITIPFKTQTYDNIFRVDSKSETTDCKFCWIFKNTQNCEYCKKSTEKINSKVEIEEKKIILDDNKWQCNACLTNNNTGRQTCYCCGFTRVTNTDVRIIFNNKTFIEPKSIESQKVNINNSFDSTVAVKNDIEKPVITEETSTMNFKNILEDHVKASISNSNIQTMDIETNTIEFNDSEKMEVEEIVTENKNVTWNPAPIFDFNITTNFIPNIDNNMIFSMGSAAKKPQRKYKKAIRNIPKAFNK